ncbi:hypothetical protein MARPO_0085s0025 [Marchantia polymorpha]|uniref:Uncharacterized protein n=1 Tax=Marchantia polymorpha TaxID=3197 RepID=A0A2R6WIX9_MARPO|nr:hypothetical protein MARPO_0085s0025 [Marchantia polymorpha]|eukprot:PTQ33802.1 hypothetical protein MARPO_0085s0025 [Marchantia polymorpha]
MWCTAERLDHSSTRHSWCRLRKPMWWRGGGAVKAATPVQSVTSGAGCGSVCGGGCGGSVRALTTVQFNMSHEQTYDPSLI